MGYAIDLKTRFDRQHEKTSSCWLWTGHKDGSGYGVLSVGPRGAQKKVRAHRVAYEFYTGSIPAGQWVLHKCDVRACVNPEHLFLGDHKENMADMVAKGRSVKTRGNGKLSAEQVLEIRGSTKPLSYFVEKFGVSKSTVSYVRNGRTWQEIAVIPPA